MRAFNCCNKILNRAVLPSKKNVLFQQQSFGRSMSTTSSSDLVSFEADPTNRIVSITMRNLPVNSLSLEMNVELVSAIREAESMSNIEGLVLQSQSPTVFSAGIDLSEIHNPDSQRLVRYWESFQELYITLYGSRLACLAAIEGHAMAGGCMLALSCDYRIMTATTENFRPQIGLNETKLGIAAPPWLGRQLIDTIGRRHAEKSLQMGTLYSPEQALSINLIDEVVPKENVRQRAKDVAISLSNIPSQGRVASKQLVRNERIELLLENKQADIVNFVSMVTDDIVQKNLATYLEMMAKKSSGKTKK